MFREEDTVYRYFFIAKNNIKKQKSDMITFFILSALASLFIFISLSFMTGAGKVVDTCKEKINGADIFFMLTNNEAAVSKVEEVIKGNVYLKNCETERTVRCSSKYRHKGDKTWIEYPFAMCCYEDENKIQKMSIDASGYGGNEIVLPASLMTSFSKGDIIQIKIEENVYDLKVADFNEDNLFSGPMNIGIYKSYVSGDVYEDILFENPTGASEWRFIKTQITDTAKKKKLDIEKLSDNMGDEFLNWYDIYVKDHPVEEISINFFSSEMMKTGAMILPMMFVALVLLFAIIMFIIAIVIIDFSVKNFIMTNMKNTAIMEAAGYTVRELVMILLCQLMMIAGTGAVIGVLAGTATIGKVSVIMLVTLGLPWNQPINIPVAIFVVIGVSIVISMLTLLLGREYSRVSVLDALRGGVNTHNYKKNYFAFDKTAFPVSVTLSLKETFGRFRSQLGVIFIMMILAVSTIIGFGMADTYGTDEGCIALSGIDMYDADITGSEAMAESIRSMSTVRNVRMEIWMSYKYYNKNLDQSLTTRGISDVSTIEGGYVIDGRWPINPNEVMLAANAANKLNVKVGDVVTIKTDKVEESYIVCGLNQTFNNLGMMAYMTLDGMSKVSKLPDSMSICINLKPGVTFEAFEKEIKEAYPEVEITDVNEAAHQTVGMITIGMKAFAFLIAGLTILIVSFVESLIVRTNINKQWRNMGVSKALGFTSKQLIGQVMLSNMPAILIGVIVGLIVAKQAGTGLMVSSMAIFGFKKVTFTVKAVSYIYATVIIVGVALLSSAFMGRRIRTLEPVRMITEE
ncbi:MAG: FtsX-like permease family protein [Lachnospiraceae bacterium]|nr:FtsX-like permease family protein [Lachnospiraceae bacterium]